MGKPEIIVRRQVSPLTPEVNRIINQLLGRIRHGTLTLVVQDGVVLQVNATEKVRLEASWGTGTGLESSGRR